jgi:hypothetical protein
MVLRVEGALEKRAVDGIQKDLWIDALSVRKDKSFTQRRDHRGDHKIAAKF